MSEQWRDVVGYEGLYQVSDHGRVRRANDTHKSKTGHILGQSNSRGYRTVGLYKSGKRNRLSAHSLVAYAFIGARPSGMQINHIDGNKENNHVSNLEYCTPSQNIQHAMRLGLIKITSPVELHWNAKLTLQEVAEIRAIYSKGGITQKAIAKRFGTTQSNVSFITKGIRWQNKTIVICGEVN